MQLLNRQTAINFIAGRKIAFFFSLVLIVAGVTSFITQGMNMGIDFTGGTKVELTYTDDIAVKDLRTILENNGYDDVIIQYFGTSKDVLIRIPLSQKNSGAQVSTHVIDILKINSPSDFEVRSVEFVGPQFGKELMEKGILALVYALIIVMIYVMFRFEWKFSIGSVVALVHDVVITVGLFCILRMEFTLPVLAALLAVIGYSLNDTIVVFDRIRENFRKLRENNTQETMNISINQTLPRTILTSLTTLLVLVALYVFGGDALQGFSATLIIGVLIGTYSSIFVASPVVLALGAKAEDLIVEVVEVEGADQPDMYIP